MKILLVGGGGREHALAYKIAQSPIVSELICAPGNAGIAQICECVNIGAGDVHALVDLAVSRGVEFVVIGPEQPLTLGLVDALAQKDIPAFGPSQLAAQMEGSKAFMKDFCARHNIPTARYGVFTDIEAAKDFLGEMTPPFVIKTDGLAAGKGVVIPETLEAAHEELQAYFSGKFGAAGQRVIIEEFMQGEEVSFFAVTDGKIALPFGAAQDHKRVGEGDTGPNTGGMGAYAPAPVFTPDIQARVMDEIITPTVNGMSADGMPYVGVLFAGLMITNAGPRLIEYNARFGDPECQVIMRMLQSDIMEVFIAATNGNLANMGQPEWNEAPTVNVVMCAAGYPGGYEKGSEIKGLLAAGKRKGVHIFHAGTRAGSDSEVLANGGRVLNITAQAETLRDALDAAYAAIDQDIDWPEGFVRRDIGWRAL